MEDSEKFSRKLSKTRLKTFNLKIPSRRGRKNRSRVNVLQTKKMSDHEDNGEKDGGQGGNDRKRPCNPDAKPIIVNNSSVLQIRPFDVKDPDYWFDHLEAVLEMNDVPKERYFVTLKALIPNLSDKNVKRCIKAQAAEGVDRYAELKSAVMATYTLSEEKKVQSLLEDQKRGDKSPSQFLDQLRAKAPEGAPEVFLKTIWMREMTPATKGILAIVKDQTLSNLAEMADKIEEQQERHKINAISIPHVQEVQEPCGVKAITKGGDSMEQLCKIMLAMQEELRNEREERRKYREDRQSRNRSRARGNGERRPARQRSVTPAAADGLCYAHRKFGAEARTCTRPCKFFGEPKNE